MSNADVESTVPFILGRIEGKVDQVVRNQELLNEAFSNRMNDHGQRIRNLEGSRAWVIGAAAALGLCASWLKDLFFK